MLKLTLRNLFARKVRLLMSTIAIVLGIGFLAGVQTFGSGLNATFDNIVQGSTSDGQVRVKSDLAPDGLSVSSATITPKQVDKIAAVPEVGQATGSVDGYGANLLDSDGKLVGGQGAPTLVFNYAQTDNMLGDPVVVLEDGDAPGPGQVTLDSTSAERGGYEIGDSVTLLAPFGEAKRTFTLSGIANLNGGGTAGAILVLLDTPDAQKMFTNGKDVYTSVTLTAADGVSQQQLVDAVNQVVPKDFEAVTGDQVADEANEQIGQFLGFITTFLQVFAGIAILVGGFIIANTFSILVAQRVRESALLRALGATRRQVTRSVLIEAFVMALVGATLGIGLGLLLARGVAALFRSFGLDIAGDVLTLTGPTVILSYAVALVVTLASAYFPARRAGKVAPVAAMRDDLTVQEAGLHRRTVFGVVAIVVGAILAAIGLIGGPGNDAWWIGAGSVIWVITAAVLAPVLGRPLLVACRGLFGRLFGMPGRLAGENALRNPRRTGATASALMIGLAIVSAVGVLASSTSKTYDTLIDDQFSSDFLVQSPTFQGFGTSIGDQMAEVDGVDIVSRMQAAGAQIDGQTEYVAGVDGGFAKIYRLDMLQGTEEISGNEAIISKSASEKYGATVGSTLDISFPSGGEQQVEVVGIFDDTPVASGVTVPLSVFEDAGLKRFDMQLSINVADGADVNAVHQELDAIVAELPIVSVQDKEEFAESAKAQINQLLYIIYGLLALAIIIAIFGIVNTLGLSVIERTREIGLLRAVGLSRAKLRRMITLESVTIAVLGAVLGMAVGLVVGILLRQSLADDLTELGLPLTSLVVFLVIAVFFGVLAAILPAIRASRLKVLDAIAQE